MFRFNFSDTVYEDVTFYLNGSSSAIDKVVDLSKIGKNDWQMEMILGGGRIVDAIHEDTNLQGYLSKNNISNEKFLSSLIDYLNKNLSQYHITFIQTLKTKDSIIYIYNLNNELLLTVDLSKL